MAKQKLTVAHEKFSSEMLKRLREKQRAGYTGWDDNQFDMWDVPRRMHDKALDVLLAGERCDPMDLIDIANFAMFLHRKVSANMVDLEQRPERPELTPDICNASK